MAISKCAACGNTSFEVKLVEPSGASFKQFFVQCRSCGVPVGVLDYFNLGTIIKDQEKKVDDLGKRLSRIESAINQIVNALNQRR